MVRVTDAPRKDQRVIIRRTRIPDRHVRLDPPARLVVDGGHDLLQIGRSNPHPRAPLHQNLARTEQLAFLEAIGGHDQHPGFANLRHLGTLVAARCFTPPNEERSTVLRHSSDSEPGYTRKRHGRYWQYFDEEGKRLTD